VDKVKVQAQAEADRLKKEAELKAKAETDKAKKLAEEEAKKKLKGMFGK
jgi:AsmA protein